jgi:hypothetical protein
MLHFFLNVRLLDRVLVAFKLRDFLSVGTVSLDHKGGRPEKDDGGGCDDCVIRSVLVLRSRCDGGARGHTRGLLSQLRTRIALILKGRDVGLCNVAGIEKRSQPTLTPPRKRRLCALSPPAIVAIN